MMWNWDLFEHVRQGNNNYIDVAEIKKVLHPKNNGSFSKGRTDKH